MIVLAFPKPAKREAASAEDAQHLAIEALRFIASHDDLVRRFLDVTGIEPAQIRAEAARPAFLVGVLDFILGNENDVIDFADQVATDPQRIGVMRNALAVSAGIPGEDYPS